MKKTFLPLVVVSLLASVILYPYQGYAVSEIDKINQDIERVKREKAEADRKKREAENQVQHIRAEKAEETMELNTLQQKIEQTADKLNALTRQIETVTADLERTMKQLNEAEKRVATRDKLLKSRLRLMYTNGFVSYLDVLMSSTDFADFLDRYEALKSIVSRDKDILAENKKDRDTVKEKKKQVEVRLAEVNRLHRETAALQQTLQVQEKQKEVHIASLNEQEKELEEISEEQQQAVMKLASLEAALIRKKNSIKVNYYKGGKLGFPLPKLYPQTSGFGSRVDPITGKRGAFHSGLDFGAPAGTSILAAEKGVVIVAQWMNGYGNTVIIDHGNGLWTLYGHIRPNGIKVEKGQIVERGDKIAEVGTTGRSTGNHLHFEVRLNERAVDPTNYLR